MNCRQASQLLEAAIALVQARLIILLSSPQRLNRLLARPGVDGPPADEVLAREVGLAVDRAARHLPGVFVCLPRAMAAKAMLTRRRRAAHLHLGAARGRDGEFTAHAWLASGERIVVGEKDAANMADLVCF